MTTPIRGSFFVLIQAKNQQLLFIGTLHCSTPNILKQGSEHNHKWLKCDKNQLLNIIYNHNRIFVYRENTRKSESLNQK